VAVTTVAGLARLLTRRVAVLDLFTNRWVVALAVQGIFWLRVRHALYGDPVGFRYTLLFGYTSAIYLLGAVIMWLGWRRVLHAGEPSLRPARILRAPATVFAAVLVAALLLESGASVLAAGSVARSSPDRMSDAAARPNIFLLVMDTTRADHLSLYGYDRETSPNLSRLAREATVYSRAFSASDYTLPSFGAILTGRFPTSHGAHTVDPRLQDNQAVGDMAMSERMLTLPEMLSGAGYRTASVVANYGFLSPRYKLDQGFDLYTLPYPGCTPFSPAFAWRPFLARIVPGMFVWSRDAEFSNAGEVNQELFHLIAGVGSADPPVFLFANYMDAHKPYAPPPPYDTRFPGKDPRYQEDEYVSLKRAVLKQERTLPAWVRDHIISQYDGGIAYLDDQLGRLIDRLKAEGLYDDSLIIVTADHGESFGDRNLMEHNVSVYQEQIHVPLLIKYPDQSQGRVVADPVSLVDLVPTVLDVLDVKKPGGLQGRSLFAPAGEKPREILAESFPRPTLLNTDPRFHRVQRALIDWPYKLIASTNGNRELYRLDTDPAERQDIYDPADPTAQALEARLDKWLATAVAEVGEAPALDPDTLERLKSLGYVQ
jgi:arylsulfatase A-like enzyme